VVPIPANSRIGRFGPFEVNLRSGEVKKFGMRIKLGEQPVRILGLLMEREGELVTRDELRNHLWSNNNTFVDFDHSLNSAVQRLRDGLSDNAQSGKWVETVPRRGYRFVGKVEWVNGNGSAHAKEAQQEVVPQSPFIVTASSKIPAPRIAWRSWGILAAVSLAVITVAVLGVRALGRRNNTPAGQIRSLAVLPLENLSGDASQDYFADGMTDELITALAKNRALRVISRTSVMQYKKVRRPVRDIARELGVDGILEGSISRASERVHMNVQLVDAATDTHLWAETYDRGLNDALALPSELSQTIAKEVKVAVTTPSPARYVNPEAHDLYLRGRYFFFADNDAPGIEYLQKAVEMQPDYAAAWSAISDYYGGRSVSGAIPPGQYRTIWEADARKAIELDDSLSDAHNSLAAWYFFGEWDWQRARDESERATALNSNNAEAYHLYSYILTVLNRPSEALEAQKHGMEVDPFARPWALGLTYYYLHQFDAAINDLRLRERGNENNAGLHGTLAEVLAAAGHNKEAVDEWVQMALVSGDRRAAEATRHAFAQGGYQAVVESFLAEDKVRPGRYVSPIWHAMDTARAQHKEETLQLLEDAYREHSPRLVFLLNEPRFDFLHSEPRFQDIARKMSLPNVDSRL